MFFRCQTRALCLCVRIRSRSIDWDESRKHLAAGRRSSQDRSENPRRRLLIIRSFYRTRHPNQQAKGLVFVMNRLEPIHRAAFDGDVEEVTRLLLEDGQRVDRRFKRKAKVRFAHGGKCNARGLTPLLAAVVQGQDAVVERLLELGADPDLVHPRSTKTAAHLACAYNLVSILTMLLNAGARLDVRDSHGTAQRFLLWLPALVVPLSA